jgi:heat shock protein HslJ
MWNSVVDIGQNMKLFISYAIVFCGCLALVLSGIAGCKGNPPCADGPWEDIPWELTAYGDPENLQTPLEGTLISIQFITQGNQIGGTAGCNAYFGQYESDTKTCALKIGGSIATTKKACETPIMDQETKYLALLKTASRLTVKGEELRITSGKEVLVFKKWLEPK